MSIVSRRTPRSEEGFSIVEVMVASMLLLVGLLGTLTLMDGATQTVATSKAARAARTSPARCSSARALSPSRR
jgi:Tfp pilus assembly protein PilV